MSQGDAILSALQSGRVLTTLDIFKLCGSMAGHSRISDLRAQGYAIDCKRTTVNGRAVWQYSLVGPVQRQLFDVEAWAREID